MEANSSVKKMSVNNPSSTFPNNIRHYRLDHGLTVERLAHLAGCSAPHLVRLEHGEYVPKAILLHDLARSLGVLVDALFDRDWSAERKRAIQARLLRESSSSS